MFFSFQILHRLLSCAFLAALIGLARGGENISAGTGADTGTMLQTGSAQASDKLNDHASPEWWNLQTQATNVTQWHPSFTSPYQGTNSLSPRNAEAETIDLTAFLGFRLPEGTQLYLNPEVDQGFGLSNTLGVAGFTSGEAYKVGSHDPYLRLPRAFLRHVFDLGGGTQDIESGPNQLAGSYSVDNITVTIGKFSPVDIFDTNTYAHDPRADFMNWSVIESGAFDYAADSWGYTEGGAIEWNQSFWSLRGGFFALSTEPNSKLIDQGFNQQEWLGEAEFRKSWFNRPGKIKFLAFTNIGYMGSYIDAIRQSDLTATVPNTANVRHYASSSGFAVNLEQGITESAGLFARFSSNQGYKEAYEFTEINESIASGVSVKGTSWGRKDDTFGVAVVGNVLSKDARAYFAKGGNGILIGDGNLQYGPEKILEAYYAARLEKFLTVGLDYQYVINPAYNVDRGPASIFGFRVHAEF